MKWEDECRSKSQGNLGMGRLKERNIALLSKWLWRISLKVDNLWHSTISSKYGFHSNGWDVNPSPSHPMSLIWKNIIVSFPFFFSKTCLSVGNCDSKRFWKDLWWGDHVLSSSCQRLFLLSINKDAKVSEVLSYSSSIVI